MVSSLRPLRQAWEWEWDHPRQWQEQPFHRRLEAEAAWPIFQEAQEQWEELLANQVFWEDQQRV